MTVSILFEYGWVLLVLIGLEGILAADNAVVMAVLVNHLPAEKQKKALFFGLAGAFVFRFATLFMISFLSGVWQVQAAGAIYLFYFVLHHFYEHHTKSKMRKVNKKGNSSFWATVLKVELADIAFAVDSMLAAVALAITITPIGWFKVGGIDGGQFIVMFTGGMIGIIIIRFAASWFISLLKERPSLETAAFLIVGWVGVKLAVFTLSHPQIALLNEDFPQTIWWKLVFWSGLITIAVLGFINSPKSVEAHQRH